MVYFNLSQAAADPKQATFIEEERPVWPMSPRRRPKDDLLITFASTKPSDFLWNIALNPAYMDVDEGGIRRRLIFSQLQLKGRMSLLSAARRKETEAN